jgi:hypothetical protein
MRCFSQKKSQSDLNQHTGVLISMAASGRPFFCQRTQDYFSIHLYLFLTRMLLALDKESRGKKRSRNAFLLNKNWPYPAVEKPGKAV